MLIRMRRKFLLALLTMAALISLLPALTASAAIGGTLTFSGATGSSSINMGTIVLSEGTYNGVTSSGISGIQLELLGTNDSTNPTPAGSLIYYDAGFTGTSNGLIYLNEPDTTNVFVIKSDDGNQFSFSSIYLDSTSCSGQIKFEGFKDGNSKASVKVTAGSKENVSQSLENVPFQSVFGNVDEVRITNPQDEAGTLYGNYVGINNIAIGDPIMADTATSTVSASPSIVAPDGTATSTITVTLKDVGGNAVRGKKVSLSQGSGSSTISPAEGTTNLNGQATFTVKNTKVEYVTYIATDSTDDVTVAQTATVTYTTPNTAPSFIGSTTTLTVDENVSATDITSFLHASDTDSGQTLTWSESVEPNHGGSLSFSAATASTGGTNIIPGGTITYTPADGYSGTETFTVQVSDGTATATREITVKVKASQTITFTNPGDIDFGSSPTLTATSSSGLTVSFTSASTSVATITSGGTLSTVSTGSVTICADQAGDADYMAAEQVPQTFNIIPVVPAAPTIGTATAGDAQASVSFSAPAFTGGVAITGYTVTSSGGQTGTGTSSPILVTGLTNGTAYTFTVTATNGAGTGSASGSSNSVTPKGVQTITFENPGAQNFGTTPILTATSDSGLDVTFTSDTPDVCDITSDGVLTFKTAGTATIIAHQAGNEAYVAASDVTQSFIVNAVVPDAPTIGMATVGDTQATVSFAAPTSNGGAAITGYTVTSNPGSISASGAVSPITVTGLSNGTAYTFTVTATNYVGISSASAPSNSVTPKGVQTITFENPGAQNFGTTPILTATSDSGLDVTFTSETSGVCEITSSGTLKFLTAGTAMITAHQAGNEAYLAAPDVTRSFTVNAVVPDSPTIGTATAGDTQATVSFTAPASSGGSAITVYTVTSNPGGFTASGPVSPITVTGLSNGTAYTFTVTATNGAGTGPALGTSNAVTPKGVQTITFANPGAQSFGTTPTLTATSDSGLAVTFTSDTPDVCDITSSGVMTFKSIGTATIRAQQAGNETFAKAADVTQSFSVNAVAPGAPTIGLALSGDFQATVSFTAPAFTGGAAITEYTVTSNPGGISATGAASPIIVTGLSNGAAYTFTVTATNSAGTSVASEGSNIAAPIGHQTITFEKPGTQNFGTTPKLTATSSSGLPITFTSDDTSVCTVTSDGVLTFLTTGVAKISAQQAGNEFYSGAYVTQSFFVRAVVPGAPTIGIATAGITQATVNFTTPTFTGGAAITGYTVTSSGGQTGTGTSSPIIVTGLSSGIEYTFTVTATNSAGTSSASAVSNSMTPIAVTLTGTPDQALTETNLNGRTVTLAVYGDTFVAALNKDRFILENAPNGLTIDSVNRIDDTHAIISLAYDGTDFDSIITNMSILANGDQLVSGNSLSEVNMAITANIEVTPIVTTTPATSTTPTSAVVSGSVIADGGEAVTKRGVQYKNSSDSVYSSVYAADGGTGSFNVSISELTPNTVYTARTFATNVVGTTFGNEISFTTRYIIPGVPVLTATARDRSVNLNWDAGVGTVSYSVYKGTSTGVYGDTALTTVAGSVYSINITGLVNGTPYYFVVKAINGDGVIKVSNEVSATPISVPGVPTGVTAAAGNEQATVTFTAPSDNGGSAITQYIVTSDPDGVTATGTGTTITVTGLTNGKAYTFTVKALNAAGESIASTASNSVTPKKTSKHSGNTTTTTAPTSSSTAVDIQVNDKSESAGTATNSTNANGQTVITVTVDEDKLNNKLQQEGKGAVITIPMTAESDVLMGELSGQMVKYMEEKEAVLKVKTASATYTLPAASINIDAVSAQIGSQVALEDIKLTVEIAKVTADTAKIVESSAKKGEFTIITPPVKFNVICTSGDKTVNVSSFNSYVERTIAIPDGIDPNKITTGVVIESDGTVRHVPTKVEKIDGKYYAKINSLTNSIYSVVWHPYEFKDAANHWAKNEINDMGSRMVVSGVSEGMYEPDRDITRAEFAAIMVKALGLKPGEGSNPFTDVNATDWYADYVKTAVEYKIIFGYGDGQFAPMNKITREEAMTMIVRAMSITNLKVELTKEDEDKLLEGFNDGSTASDWAKSNVAVCVKAGIVTGRDGRNIAPNDSITRAEVATIVQKLLQESGLIN